MNSYNIPKEKNNPADIVKRIVQFHGVNLPGKTVDKSFERLSFAPSMFIMQQFFQEFMFDCNYVQLKPESLKGVLFPAVAFVDDRFILLIQLTGNGILYHDTELGLIMETYKSFSKKWDGELLMITPTEFCGEVELKIG